jgi:predicted nucleic acid-binding Zn ribbon protein
MSKPPYKPPRRSSTNQLANHPANQLANKPAPRGKSAKHQAHLTAAADVLQVLLQNSKSELSDGFLRWRLEQQWDDVVGAVIAQQTLPVAFEKGSLFIWVRHPTWMQQLWYFQDVIKEKVNRHLEREPGREWCRQVKFTLNRRAAQTEQERSGD